MVPPLVEAWSIDLGGDVSYPLIADGRVFVTVRNSNVYGTKLHARSTTDGSPLWGPIDIPGTYFWSNAAYDAGRVFVVNFDGVLSAFEAATGDLAWSVQLPGQYAFSSPPTAIAGFIYVGGAGSGGTLYAVSEADGAVKWTAGVANGDNSSPVVDPSGVYVSYACDQVYRFALSTGTLIWQYSTGCSGGGGRTPALFGGKLYVRDWATSNVILDAATGTDVGTFTAAAIPAFSGTTAFFLEQGTLQARDVTSLQPTWSFDGDGGLISAPIVAGGYVYEGESSGALHAIDAQTGTAVWSTDVGAPINGPDEQNLVAPLTGLAAAEGVLIVPASTHLIAYSN